MTNEIINGMIAAIVAEFPGIPVYDETVDQGLVEPSFSVRCVRPIRKNVPGDRYYQENLMEVVYFPPSENRYQNSNEVVERLFECLELLTLSDNGKIRGRDMQSTTTEDFTVVFTVTYSDFLYRQPSNVYMHSYTQTTEVGD